MVGLVGVKDTIRNFINWGLVDFLTNRKFAKFRLVKRYCLITNAMPIMMNYQFNVKCQLFVFRIRYLK